MSSTTGFQNLLVNVFRPVYRYEIPPGNSNSIFVPKLEISNIDTFSGNTISVFTAAVGDANNNVYVGSNAGNPYTVLNADRFVSAFGYGAAAGISNVSNSVFVGYNAGAGAADAANNVIIGDNTSGNGSSNVRIGSSNTGTGSSNVSIGAGTAGGVYSNTVLLGPRITATKNYEFRVGSSYLYGDVSTNWLGVGRPTPMDAVNGKFDVSGNVNIQGQVGINMIPTRTFDIDGDFRASDASGTLDFTNGVTNSTSGFASIHSNVPLAALGTTFIGSVKKGTIVISVVDQATDVNSGVFMLFAPSTTSIVPLISNVTGSTSIPVSLGNINIAHGGLSSTIYDYNITYFPLP